MSLFTETVTLLSRQEGESDDLGNDTYSWVQAESSAWVEIGQGTEDTNQRETSDATSTVYLPLETLLPVEAVSKIVWRGREWDVVGEPGVQPGGFVVDGYQRFGIKRVNG